MLKVRSGYAGGMVVVRDVSEEERIDSPLGGRGKGGGGGEKKKKQYLPALLFPIGDPPPTSP